MSAPFSWQARVDAALELSQRRRRPAMGHPKITFRSPAAELIRQAAARRGLTVAGFSRRATLAMAAQVLELAFEDLCAVDPTIQRAGFAPAPDPSGVIGGPWQITGLRDPMS